MKEFMCYFYPSKKYTFTNHVLNKRRDQGSILDITTSKTAVELVGEGRER